MIAIILRLSDLQKNKNAFEIMSTVITLRFYFIVVASYLRLPIFFCGTKESTVYASWSETALRQTLDSK